ncbi:fungal-specific transcription factor domain-containing protein [Dipodascopsis tothii]|uniref:fungal-specific transcription factor domain-containing protein n=1 Tax=Dipodascopsis tothii TaxID=44089 RepID=UPI0034CE7D4E
MSNADDANAPDDREPGAPAESKRRRIARACDSCRKKKIKCDGKLPSCTNCMNYKTVCVITYTEKKRNPPKGTKYIENLESRLIKMEGLVKAFLPEYGRPGAPQSEVDSALVRRLRSVAAGEPVGDEGEWASRDDDDDDGDDDDGDDDDDDASEMSSHNSPDDNLDFLGDGAAKRPRSAELGDSTPESTPASSGAGAAKRARATSGHEGSDSLDEKMEVYFSTVSGNGRYIGLSSSFSMMSPKGLKWIEEKVAGFDDLGRLREILAKASTLSADWCDDRHFGAGEIPADGVTRSRELFPLPPEDKAKEIVGEFLATFNPLMPVFTDEDVWRLVRNMYARGTKFQIAEYVAFNAILAVSTRISPTGNDKTLYLDTDNNWKYFLNAMAFYNELTCGLNSILGVQTLLTLAVYIQSSECMDMTFVIVSTAVRMAQGIGLHSRGTSVGLPPATRAQRKRVFWICYIFDKSLSLRFGRPPTIYDQDVSTDLPTEVEGLCQMDSDDPSGRGKGDTFFYAGVKLARIQSKAYTKLYSAAACKVSEHELLNIIGELDRELLAWRDSLPLRHRPDHEIIEDDPLLMMNVIYMHLDYYNCLITIHRMSMHHPTWNRRSVKHADAGKNLRMLYPRVYASAALCVQAARATLHLHGYVQQFDMAFAWMVMYYTITSLMILFANCVQNPKQASSRSDLALMAVGITFMERMLPIAHYADRLDLCLLLLRELQRLATSVVEQSQPSPATGLSAAPSAGSTGAAPTPTAPPPDAPALAVPPPVSFVHSAAQDYAAKLVATDAMLPGQVPVAQPRPYPLPTQYLDPYWAQSQIVPGTDMGLPFAPPAASPSADQLRSFAEAAANSANDAADAFLMDQSGNFDQPFIPKELWGFSTIFNTGMYNDLTPSSEDV